MNEERLLKRVGVYGGTFDPIHNGHLKVAGAILKSFAMDRMLFVPAFVPPHKSGREISSPYHRAAMLALATAGEGQIFISTIELEAPSRPYTIETLARLQSQCEEAQLFFVMGTDSFKDISMWREYERILSEYHVIVATRPGYTSSDAEGYDLGAHLPLDLRERLVDLRGGLLPSSEIFTEPRTYFTDYVSIDVSSTDVRRLVMEGRPIEGTVAPEVARYIAKYKLYQKSECQKF